MGGDGRRLLAGGCAWALLVLLTERSASAATEQGGRRLQDAAGGSVEFVRCLRARRSAVCICWIRCLKSFSRCCGD